MELWGTQPLLEYGDRLSWNKLYSGSFQAQQLTTNPPTYSRLSPISLLTESNILQVGCGSVNIKPNWWIGCWLSVCLNALPSSTSQFSNWVEIKRYSIPLGKLTLIEFPQYEPQSYRLNISIPRWFTDFYLEIWWYDGLQGNSLEAKVNSIKAKTDLL